MIAGNSVNQSVIEQKEITCMYGANPYLPINITRPPGEAAFVLLTGDRI
jgi:hypothetical protein